jgi:hypothetical protein
MLVDWCRPSPPQGAVTNELPHQLLTRERELDSREGAIATWEDRLATSEHTLGGREAKLADE